MNRRPLDGITVLDLSIALTPVTAMLLADFGANVIKIEKPKGDIFARHVSVSAAGGEKESSVFISVERNKRGVTIDWHTEEGRKVLLELAKKADVFIENYNPGHAEKWGIGYDDIKAVNPRIIYCSVTAFGRKGPLAHKKAIDLIMQAYAGHMAITGPIGGPPVKCGPPSGDFPAVYLAAFGILAALRVRDQSGIGQRVDVSLLDAAMLATQPREQEFWLAGRSTEPLGTRHVSVVPHQAFETSDGRWIAVAVLGEDDWKRFCKAIGQPALAADARYDTVVKRYENREVLIGHLERHFRTKPLSHWFDSLDAADIVCGPILTTAEALENPQLLLNGMIQHVDHPRAGRIKVLGVPVSLSETPGAITLPPPTLGQHTDEVLRDAGIGQEEIAALRRKGIV